VRTAVFVSGRGSNLKSLLDEKIESDLFVFSNRKTEPAAFSWARRRGVFTDLVALKSDKDWTDFAQRLNRIKIEKIFLLGFMKIVPKVFLQKISAFCVNLHPSVLPDFPGLEAIEKSFENEKSRGCSLHEVSEVLDAGRLLLQKEVTVPADFFSVFSEQVHQSEQDTVSKFVHLNFLNSGQGGTDLKPELGQKRGLRKR